MDQVKSFYFKTKKRKIYGTLIGNSKPIEICTIYFAPLFEERLWSHRVAFNFAKDLYKNFGHAVFIFDYHGYGESEGNSEDFSIKHCKEDLVEIINLLKGEYGFNSFILWGIRTGCRIAYECLNCSNSIIAIVFWVPVIDLKNYIIQSLRFTISTQSILFKKIVAKRDDILQELLEFGKCEREGYQLNYIDYFRFGSSFYKELIDFENLNFENQIKKRYNLLVIDITNKTILSESTMNDLEKYFKLTYKSISAKEFWGITSFYSQRSDDFYHETIEWYNKNKIFNSK